MGIVTQIAPSAAPGLPEVTGFVEAVTTDRMLGWTWVPRAPGLRAVVELRLGDEVVAEAVADRSREDLARNGVGDGCHAFELAIPESLQGRAGELSVFARAGDREPVALRAPPAAEALSDQIGQVLRSLEALMGSQRVLHRNLQVVLTQPPEMGAEGAAALVRSAEMQAALADQISAVERFVVRLDERLAALPSADAPVRGRLMPRAALWALAVSCSALVVSIAGLVRSFGG